jgi:hypothetical protein
MMIVDNKFNLKEKVYLITDPDQRKRIITAIQININGVIYCLTHNTNESWHYAEEISREKDVLQSINVEGCNDL